MNDQFVSVEAVGENEADLRINSPDKTGLGCDIARVMFDFGLVIERGDFSTDGQWCFLMFRVTVPVHIQCYWALLKQRLEAILPSARHLARKAPNMPHVHYIFQVEAVDRFGLLHDVTQALWERELTVHRAHVTTSPADTAVDLFYVSDNRNDLDKPERQMDVNVHVQNSLGGGPDVRCSFTPVPVISATHGSAARPLDGSPPQAGSPPEHEEDAAPSVSSGGGSSHNSFDESQFMAVHSNGSAVATVTVDNHTASQHTVLQLRSRNRQGLFFDCMRAMKELRIQVSYGKVEVKGRMCEIDLFVGKVHDTARERYLCHEIARAVDTPVSVDIDNIGVDQACTQLSVTAPMDAAGCARPRVLLDVTDALRKLQLWVFKADIKVVQRTKTTTARKEEVHRFLLTDSNGQPITRESDRLRVSKVVKNALLGTND